MPEYAERSAGVSPFLAMEVFEKALALEAQGHSILHFEVGEPDFPAPQAALDATRRALDERRTRYTDSRGMPELRRAVSRDLGDRRGVAVDPERVIITPGTSPAMLLVFSMLISPGDEVLIPAPHYPCYPNFVRFCGGHPIPVPCDPKDGFAIHPERVEALRTDRSRALVLASPANPTGAVQSEATYRALAELGLPVLSDEIYDGLLYDGATSPTALDLDVPSFVFDGFSKRYAMTGFRLGYVVCPEDAVRRLHVLAQNTLISVSEFVQRAGIAALEEGGETVREMRAQYDRRRRRMVEGLREIGFSVPEIPRGAFYILAGAEAFGSDSMALAMRLLEEAGVAATPGVDFGKEGEGSLRFCYAVADETIEEGLARLARVLG